jgi:hypothetical protein
MMQTTNLKAALEGFSGTEGYTRYLAGLLLTDGVKYLAENAACYWLLDIIASYQPKCKKDKDLREMQFWTLKRVPNTSKAVVTCDDGNDHVKITQRIEFTDFPLDEVKVWVELGSVDGVNPAYVAMLPGER